MLCVIYIFCVQDLLVVSVTFALHLAGYINSTSDVAACRGDAQFFKMLICLWIYHQQICLISSVLDKGHHLCMSHAFYVYPVYLRIENKTIQDNKCLLIRR